MFSFPSSASASATGLFSAYASVAASAMLVRSMANEIVPAEIRAFIATAVRRLFTPLSSDVTFTVDEFSGMSRNEVFDAAELYLRTKIPPSASRLRVAKLPRQKSVAVSADQGERISDDFDGVRVTWKLVCTEPEKNSHNLGVKRHFEVTADRRVRDKVVEAYLPYVLRKAESIRLEDRVIKLYSRDCPFNDSNDRGRGGGRGGGLWGSVSFEHPATFDTLAMDPGLKRAVIEDLDRFLRRREFYKRVGRAWKRGYLLFGPPGTGKSSLIAAMANYLKFDVYDLELTGIYSNSELRRTLLATSNRSILVIEDIDCSAELKNMSDCDSDGDNGFYGGVSNTTKLTLSGLLNFIDGLWSSCGDERIIVFTTNHKDRLDPALLRPGRMDMHINMSYCTKDGFKTLASNYLGLQGNGHRLCGEIEGLIGETEVTPAEVAEELMKSDDSDVVLGGLVDFLKRKRVEAIEKEQKAAENNGGGEQEMKGGDEEEEEIVPPKSKKVKLGVNRGACRNIGRMVVRGRLRRGF